MPKPVIVSDGDDADSITSRYFTPRRCHASHAVTGAIGVATAFALPGTVVSGACARDRRAQPSRCCTRRGASTSRSTIEGSGDDARIERAALVRTARKILQGELHLPAYVFSKPTEGDKPMKHLIAPALAAAVAAAAPARDGLPRQDDHDRRAHGGRRRQRRDGAHHRAEARAAARPDRHHRQPRRRQRLDRQRVRRPVPRPTATR